MNADEIVRSINEATIYNNTAITYIGQGKYRKAMKLLKKALKIRESVLGVNHLLTIQVYCGIGNLYQKMKKYKKSYDFFMAGYAAVRIHFDDDTYKDLVVETVSGANYAYKQMDKNAVDFAEWLIKTVPFEDVSEITRVFLSYVDTSQDPNKFIY